MMKEITEKEKKLMMILFSLLLTVCLFTLGIQPMVSEIELKKRTLSEVKNEKQKMQQVIENPNIEIKFEEIKVKTRQTFEKTYQSFDSNEKIEEVLEGTGAEIEAIQIGDYQVISPLDYEKYVVQPKTQEEFEQMTQVVTGDRLKRFLVSGIYLRVKVDDTQLLSVIDALNNITPQAPGDTQPERYCLQIPEVIYSRSEKQSIDISVNMYGMEPPPIE